MNSKTVLGFDYGTSKIGVATGNQLIKTTQPLDTVSVRSGIPDWSKIDLLMQQWLPDKLVVGLPLHADGSKSKLSSAATDFGNQLQQRYNQKIILIDERYTSESANQYLTQINASKKQRIAMRDQLAACAILQSYLEDV